MRCSVPTAGSTSWQRTWPASTAPYYRVTAEVMAEVVGFHLNRGVLAAAPRPPELTVAEVLADARTVAVLEGVNDHENLGSVFRNAAGLGVDAVVFGTGCADPLYRRAVRVSMGHALLVPFARAETWPGDLQMLRDNGFRLVAMTPTRRHRRWRGDARRWRTTGGDSRRRRGAGTDRSAMRASDVRVRIPMSRGTDSLNVATAAALAFYERARLARLTVTDESTPWAMGLTVAVFVAAVTAVAIVVLSLGLIRVHPLLAVGLNLVAVGGWRRRSGVARRSVWRWFVLGSGVGWRARGLCWPWHFRNSAAPRM